MAKGSGSTRMVKPSSFNISMYAERLSNDNLITVDPDDAVYTDINQFSLKTIEKNIEKATDYDVISIEKIGEGIKANIIDRTNDEKDVDYGDNIKSIFIRKGNNLANVIYYINSKKLKRDNEI